MTATNKEKIINLLAFGAFMLVTTPLLPPVARYIIAYISKGCGPSTPQRYCEFEEGIKLMQLASYVTISWVVIGGVLFIAGIIIFFISRKKQK